MKAQDSTTAEIITAEINRGKAIELKLAGATYREIASALGVALSTAHGYVKDRLQEMRDDHAELANDLKRMQLARINKMRMSLWSKRDNPRVVDTLTRLDEREARLMGLDSPIRWEGSGPNGGPIPVSGEIDLSKLTVDQLKQLEEIVMAAQNAAVAAAPVARIAAEGETKDVVGETNTVAPETIPLSTETIAPVTDPAHSNGSHP